MTLTGWKKRLYDYMEWAMRLAYINILWLLGILLGLGVVGTFPSTISLFTLIRKWMQGEDEFKVWSCFWSTYRKEFMKGNLFGYVWVIIGSVLYFDLIFFRSFSNLISLLFTYFIFILGAIFIFALLFAFPVYVHFELPLLQGVKNSILLALSQPLYSILMALAFYLPYYLVFKLPGLLPFISGSLIAQCLMYVSFNLFNNLAKRELKNN